MKRALVLVLVLLLSGGTFFFLKKNQDNQGKSVIYSYRLSSSGGMGPQLQIESEWEGKVTVSPAAAPYEFFVTPSSTRAHILINGEERKDLIEGPLKDFEKTLKVSVAPLNGLTNKIEFTSDLDQPALMSILENQLRNLAHLLFVPSLSLKEKKFQGPCLTGQCEYLLEGITPVSYSIVRKSLAGLFVEARLHVQTDEQGLLEIKGQEDSVETGATGAETHTTFHLRRLSFGEIPLETSLKSARTIGPSLPEMSDEQKRAIVTSQLQGVTLQSILDRAGNIPPDSNEWGPLFVQLKDLLWLRPEAISELVNSIKNTKPEARFFTTGVNALSDQGTAESQEALKELSEHFKDKKVSQSILISLAQTKNPTPSTLDYLTDLANWEAPSTTASTALLARRLTGVLARTMGETPESGNLMAPALTKFEEAMQDSKSKEPDLIEIIDTLGNSGHSSIEGPLSRVMAGPFSVTVKASAVSAMRFIPGTDITQKLLNTAKTDQDPEVARSAKGALDLRCSLMPAECSADLRTWLKKSP